MYSSTRTQATHMEREESDEKKKAVDAILSRSWLHLIHTNRVCVHGLCVHCALSCIDATCGGAVALPAASAW